MKHSWTLSSMVALSLLSVAITSLAEEAALPVCVFNQSASTNPQIQTVSNPPCDAQKIASNSCDQAGKNGIFCRLYTPQAAASGGGWSDVKYICGDQHSKYYWHAYFCKQDFQQ